MTIRSWSVSHRADRPVIDPRMSAFSGPTRLAIVRVLARLNRAAVETQGIVLPPGPGTGTYGPYPTGRPAVLRFAAPVLHRRIGHPVRVTLFVDRDQLVDADLLSFTYDLPASVTVDPEPLALTVADLPDGRFNWTLVGSEVGATGTIVAECRPWHAAVQVEFVAHVHRHPHGPEDPDAPTIPWDQDNSTDMFVDVELRPLDNDLDRAVYSSEERLLLVNTVAPTVRLHIDGRGYFRDDARLFLAELLLDAITDEFALREVEHTHPPGDADALRRAKRRLVRTYGEQIHRLMLGQ